MTRGLSSLSFAPVENKPPTGPNPRRVVVEDRVAPLAALMRESGSWLLAARLDDLTPTRSSNGDEHLPLLRQRLVEVAEAGLSDEITIVTRRILAALDDLPAAIGMQGRVWAAWSPTGYSPFWDGVTGLLEEGPFDADLDTTLAWARRRARIILLRPEWDPGTYYSAGSEDDGKHPCLELP